MYWELRLGQCGMEIEITRLAKHYIYFHFLRFKSETWQPIKGVAKQIYVKDQCAGKSCPFGNHLHYRVSTEYSVCIRPLALTHSGCARLVAHALFNSFPVQAGNPTCSRHDGLALMQHTTKSWCFLSEPESLSLYCTASPQSCSKHIWHFCTFKACQNFWKKAAVFTESLSLGFCEILLWCLSNPNQKILQNYERQPSLVNWKCTSYQKIFLSWDLGIVFCFLESCQAYTACKTNIQNQANSTAAKMLKSTWSLILSHPAQKSTTPTSSTSVQNGQHGIWKKNPEKPSQVKNHSIG